MLIVDCRRASLSHPSPYQLTARAISPGNVAFSAGQSIGSTCPAASPVTYLELRIRGRVEPATRSKRPSLPHHPHRIPPHPRPRPPVRSRSSDERRSLAPRVGSGNEDRPRSVRPCSPPRVSPSQPVLARLRADRPRTSSRAPNAAGPAKAWPRAEAHADLPAQIPNAPSAWDRRIAADDRHHAPGIEGDILLRGQGRWLSKHQQGIG